MDHDRLRETLQNLPKLTDVERYEGLYVVDWGDSVSVGYTAAEVASLYESEQLAHIRAFKIHRALPDGTMELVGVPKERFALEDGMFFLRRQPGPAREDFEALKRLAADGQAPCRAKLQLAELTGASEPFVTALIYPAEFSDEISRWLLEARFQGGDIVEGGISGVTDYYTAAKKILDRAQIYGVLDATARSLTEMLQTRRLAVQR